MGRRIGVLAELMLLAAGAAAGQTPVHPTQLPYFTARSSGRVVFFSGKVMLDDGSAPMEPVRIERICDGRALFETWSDEKGGFSFKIVPGGNVAAADDASQPGVKQTDVNPLAATTNQSSVMPLAMKGCELQAVLSGYRSERVAIELKSTMDDAHVGTIFLHPLSRGTALTVSATSLAAPNAARKAYARGLEAMRVQKWDLAAAELSKAVKVYPKYAVAWYQLGLARESQTDMKGAAEAWKQAQSSDPKFVKPYESLTAMADRLGDWVESEKFSRMWIQLDAEDFPAAYLYFAVAGARLNHTDEAEHAAREGVRVDKDRRIPRLNYVLALLLMKKQQYGEAAQAFRRYVELAPNAPDANMVRQQLAKIDEMAAAAAPAK